MEEREIGEMTSPKSLSDGYADDCPEPGHKRLYLVDLETGAVVAILDCQFDFILNEL